MTNQKTGSQMNPWCRLHRWRSGLGLVAIAGLLLAIQARPAAAQIYASPDADPNAALNDPDRSSDLFSPNNANSSSLFELLHRIQTSNGRTLSDFQQDQREGIRNQADLFRQQQLDLLEQQRQTPVVEPQSGDDAAPTISE
ncbi:MAG: hypothetical protein KME20_02330 [Kaiparowitsia implicata GSE-PSE-MK54-09C]|nr:hypothetical protein [Kaiparowitsia implicata GSE-PSE-MK54-09C]